MTISMVPRVLSCKFCIPVAALTCQSHSAYSLESSLSGSFCILPLTCKQKSLFQEGHVISRPSMFHFQNQCLNNEPEQRPLEKRVCPPGPWLFPGHTSPAGAAKAMAVLASAAHTLKLELIRRRLARPLRKGDTNS